MTSHHVLGLVPARGGSKGIPRKNLAPVAGRPLLAYTAEAALKSRELTRVVLSTDDDEIAAAGRALGLEVPFRRPASLASDEATIVPVLVHALDWFVADAGIEPEAVVLLQPTSPLRRAEHVDGAVRLLRETEADTVVSVVEVPHQFNPASVMREMDGRLVPFLDGPTVTRRQDKPRVVARNGPAVLVVRPRVLREGRLYGEATRGYRMGPRESLDVDDPSDLALADLLLRHGASNPP